MIIERPLAFVTESRSSFCDGCGYWVVSSCCVRVCVRVCIACVCVCALFVVDFICVCVSACMPMCVCLSLCMLCGVCVLVCVACGIQLLVFVRVFVVSIVPRSSATYNTRLDCVRLPVVLRVHSMRAR